MGCGIEFDRGYDPSRKFCTASCAASHNNRVSPKRTREPKECQFCGGEVLSSPNIYCSTECSAAAKRQATIDAWLRDPSTATGIQGLSAPIKKHLIKEAGDKCSECGWGKVHPITGRVPLEVDHIDGDCYNNHPSNLRVLCPNCHALTPNFRALAKNSSRAYRRKGADQAVEPIEDPNSTPPSHSG